MQPSLQDIRKSLGLKKAQSLRLKSLLEEMVNEGKLKQDKSRYLPASPSLATGTKGRRKPPGSKDFSGVFSAHPDGYGFVAVEQLRQSIFIPPKSIGGALDGDLVRMVKVFSKRDARVSGEIIEVLERKRSHVRGFIHIEHGRTWVMPINEKIPPVFIEPESKSPSYAHDDLAEVIITEYPDDPRTAPEGRITKVLQDAESPETIIDCILFDLEISTGFNKKIKSDMAALAKKKPAVNTNSREDLTDLPFITIDGKDARDFDDAVCLIKLPKGRIRLLVSIADVSHFVEQGKSVDTEAYQRGTSVYFPDRVIPMLPELLSNDLCSLIAGKPRFTLTCDMELDKSGMVKKFRIYESLIKSQARLTYVDTALFFETGDRKLLGQAASCAEMLEEMLELSQILALKRKDRGALEFVFPEAIFQLDQAGMPLDILKSFPSPATKLIEQFMLEANETVAGYCQQENIPILYRVHDPPPPDLLISLHEQLHNYGLSVKEQDLKTPEGINRILSEITGHPQQEEIELAILKSMTQAQYRSTNDGHFGLGASHYAHFTSPIRRFPDLLLHRALKRRINGGEKADYGGILPAEAGATLSSLERNAADAEARVKKLYKVLLMESKIGDIFQVAVTGVSARGLWVGIREKLIEGLLPISMLPDDHYRLDSSRTKLQGQNSRKKIGIGKKLTVQLSRADRLTQELEFSFHDWGWDQLSSKK